MSQTCTEIQVEQPHLSRPTLSMLAGKVLNAVTMLNVWEKRLAERQHLSTMDELLLRDIGLDQADLRHEIGKPFWKG